MPALPPRSLKCPSDKVPMQVLVSKEVEMELCPVCEAILST
jgi:Zn-finger nucleic acid-binding protein